MADDIRVAYIFERYPTLCETFQRREIAGLCAQGVHVEVYATLPLRDAVDDPATRQVTVHSFHWWNAVELPVALVREVVRDRTLLRDGWRLLRQHCPRNRTNIAATLWGAIFAICRAAQMRRHPPDIVHAVWATGPATSAAILSRCCGIPFSMGAHSFDIHQHGGDAFFLPKLKTAAFVHTTTAANAAYLKEHANGCVPKIVLARRGLTRLPQREKRRNLAGPIRILSVARLVAIKGHRHQVAACALLQRRQVPFIARMIGNGSLRNKLKHSTAGLTDCVSWCGALPHEQVQEAYQWADIFWYTGVIDEEGSRDGLPNVIPEALSHGLPVICGPLAGALEAIHHEETGLIVDVTDPAVLADAVEQLARDEPLRRRLGENGRRWVEKNYLIENNVPILARAFREAVQ